MQAVVIERDPRLRLVAIAAALLAAAGVFGMGQRWFTRSTPVSAEEALSEYRDSRPQPAPETKDARTTKQTTAGAAAEPTSVAPRASDNGKLGGNVDDQTSTEERQRPIPGVYTYRTTGYEQAGFRRNYPTETQRIIERRPDGSWLNHHIFSAEHEEWFGIERSDAGDLMQNRRNRVTFGLITIDRDIVFDPPALTIPVPRQLGRTWKGEWSGPSYGTYTGRTFDHTSIRVGDEDVEVWAEEIIFRFQGQDQGEVRMKIWHSPVHAVAVKEELEVSVKAGPLDYHSEATLVLKSLQPQV